jgi:hypothetical protein
MRSTSLRTALALAGVALAASGVAATPAGGAPPGQGLVTTPFSINCEQIGATTVTTIPGGPPGTGPAWLTVTGQLALVQAITVTGGAIVVFEKTYGAKAGLEPTLTCTATLPNGFFLQAELVIVK